MAVGAQQSSWTDDAVRVALPVAVFAYLTVVRTLEISRTFWLLGDQIVFWGIAIAPWHQLPLGGSPSSVGGTTIGPVFCWVVWGIRHVVGPFTDNLPHAGAIGLRSSNRPPTPCSWPASGDGAARRCWRWP